MYVSYHLPWKMKSDLRLPFFIPVCAVARKPLKGRCLADKVKTEAEKSAVNNGRETGRRLLPHERKGKGITMNIIRAKDYQDMSRKAANIISAQIIMKPDCVLGLATGSTPVGTYRQLIEWYEKGDLDFSEVTSVNLDEYKGLSPENDQSYRYFMNHNLFDHINIRKDHTFVPNGLEPDAEKACDDYNKIIHDLDGIDLQLLGLGNNRHIGFNEPSSSFEKEAFFGSITPQVPASVLQLHSDVTVVGDEAALSMLPH